MITAADGRFIIFGVDAPRGRAVRRSDPKTGLYKQDWARFIDPCVLVTELCADNADRRRRRASGAIAKQIFLLYGVYAVSEMKLSVRGGVNNIPDYITQPGFQNDSEGANFVIVDFPPSR